MRNEASVLPTSTVCGRTGPGEDPRERPRSSLPEQADHADLRREEQEQDRHRRREVGRQAELADRRLLVHEGGRWGGGRGLGGNARLFGGRQRGRGERLDRRDRQLDGDHAIAEPLRHRPRDLGRESLVARPDDAQGDRLAGPDGVA